MTCDHQPRQGTIPACIAAVIVVLVAAPASSWASLCGNAVVDPNEVCDGGTASCSSLGESYTGGTASCRADCSGWNVSTCTRAGSPEIVKPNFRYDTKYPDALCNNGTPYGFYVRMASSPSAKWMIYLEGGGYCDDVSKMCDDRLANRPELTKELSGGDRTLVASLPLGGIGSSDSSVNPDFYNVNQVYMQYCSSDMWSGTSASTQTTTAGSWYFAGHANFDATIDMLIAYYGLDDKNPNTKVLLTGGSAGAFGVHFNASRAAGRLPTAFGAGRLLLFVDTGWYINWADLSYTLGGSGLLDYDVWAAARDFWTGTWDAVCESMVTDPVKCIYGSYWSTYLANAGYPLLVEQSRQDSKFMIGDHGLLPSDADAAAWRTMEQNTLNNVRWLFSGVAPHHTLADSDTGFATVGGSWVLRDVVHFFWIGGPPIHDMY